MLKIAGAIWILWMAFYAIVTINQNNPELGLPATIVGAIIGMGLIIRWSR
jgi:hypothetical protein